MSREDFDAERQALEEQIPQIRRYVDYMLKYTPQLVDSLVKVSLKPKGGQVVTSLSSFLTAIRHPNAQQQLAVLKGYVEKIASEPGLAEFHRHHISEVKEMQYLSQLAG
ncbi:hypothetical protein [Methylomonas sp. YC3]